MSPSRIIAATAEVLRIQDLSPSLRRVTLGGDGMAGFGVQGAPLDMRIKLIIPPADDPRGERLFDLPGFLDRCEAAGESWYRAWLSLDAAERGTMRTYTVRAWREDPDELDVDMVMHVDDQGRSGPAAAWALAARAGDRLHVLGPSRGTEAAGNGAIEYRPGDATDVLLAGDETGLPAIASILEAAPARMRGHAVIEVPHAGDRLGLRTDAAIEITWLVRDGEAPGRLLADRVRALVPVVGEEAGIEVEDVDIDAGASNLWETQQLLAAAVRDSAPEEGAGRTGGGHMPFYAWVAGEAGAVTAIRRHLVGAVGIDRRRVAFMGYWRIGRAES